MPVHLVGAGPGDPGLITVRGAQLLRRADCVLYDRLVDPALLDLTRRNCERINVGKTPGREGRDQKRINRLLVQKGRTGKRVVRLKGGDPTLFGRAGEELAALARAGIPAQIVPGVSSAWAGPALAGLLLTERRFGSSVAIVTGREAAGKRPSVRWEALAQGADTLVVLMGFEALPRIIARLRRAGKPAATPVTLVRWAATPRQEVLTGTLGTIERELAKRPDIGSPVITVIGPTARPVPAIAYRPLREKRILVTRPTTDSQGLVGRLSALGARCVKLPTIAIRPVSFSKAAAAELVGRLRSFDWIILTSHHGMEGLVRLAKQAGRSLRKPRGKVCAIGPRTAAAVRAAGWTVDLLPDDFSLVGLERAFRRLPLKGKRLLIPRSNLGMRDPLAAALGRRGARVEEVTMYRTVEQMVPAARFRAACRDLHAATFTSASTVTGFVRSARRAGLTPARLLNGVTTAAIGPATRQALRRAGVRKVHLPSDGWTVEGLTALLRERLS
ncbi:MAG: uroporphyrinogen-III C-methyltransferase [Candidatus Omnitrophica bacterium CG11_big_fil_rev_8_21_14_0_20_64_10]|nr:MAG: uroporphyrinogen-III C-methyltransferase [Candidatus Omnitrophica bacterium CG11_big_fil_rev_8_21_14_0_20_64_10]